MSLQYDLTKLSEADREKIAEELTIRVDDPKSRYSQYSRPQFMYPYLVTDTSVSVPFAWGMKELGSSGRRPRSSFPSAKLTFSGEYRSEQKVVRSEAVGMLNTRGTALISAYPGFGKTFIAVGLGCRIGFKTLVLVNKVVLMKQWEQSILKFTSGSSSSDVQIVKPATKTQREEGKSRDRWRGKWKSATWLIMNAQNVCKMPVDFFGDIGCVIVDECHQLMASSFSKALQYLHPRYLIGLSATPYRTDGLNQLLDLYFSSEKIVRKLTKKHTVFEVPTGFTPPVEKTAQGRINWNAILEAQSTDPRRNSMIIDAVEALSTRVILILTKRVTQAEFLVDQLRLRGHSVEGLYGTRQTFDRECRILIGTSSKIGVGFDHHRLDCLILASDVEEYFIQFLGRVFRSPLVEPVIVDFVDNNSILKKHFRTRKSIYKKHGGTIVSVLPSEIGPSEIGSVATRMAAPALAAPAQVSISKFFPRVKKQR